MLPPTDPGSVEANEKILSGTHEDVVHHIDEESAILIQRGFVPTRHVGPFGSSVTWSRAGLTSWPSVVLTLVLCLFFLGIIAILAFR